MYVDKVPHKAKSGKVYYQYLLRSSRREGKKTIKTTIFNITPWGEATCEAIALALKHKERLADLLQGKEGASPCGVPPVKRCFQGKSIGSVWLLSQLAQRLGITGALGDTQEGRLALWQVLARTLDQGSRLSSVRLAKEHELGFLQLGYFDEDDLYRNLDWIAKNQEKIENTLFQKRQEKSPVTLFLYDVTSSYFEGVKNELAEFGYNRDKKRGKMQIVVGLLCDDQGVPVSIEVFKGNTSDPKTLYNQVKKVKERLKCTNIVFVGDRGMIKGPQQEELTEAGFDFISALTKPQIETLLKLGTFQLDFFDEKIAEVVTDDEKRYIVRRNPVRANEIATNRTEKYQRLEKIITKRNDYLKEHSKAKQATALKQVQAAASRLRIDSWTAISQDEAGRTISVSTDQVKLAELSRLDGCYCLTTSLSQDQLAKELVHARYKDLSQVEHAFRTCKTGQLELRPIYVRNEDRTRAHVFVVMLSYLLVYDLRKSWQELDMTIEEGLNHLSTLGTVGLELAEGQVIYEVPVPRETLQQLYDASGIEPPTVIPGGKTTAASKKKLQNRRKSKNKK